MLGLSRIWVSGGTCLWKPAAFRRPHAAMAWIRLPERKLPAVPIEWKQTRPTGHPARKQFPIAETCSERGARICAPPGPQSRPAGLSSPMPSSSTMNRPSRDQSVGKACGWAGALADGPEFRGKAPAPSTNCCTLPLATSRVARSGAPTVGELPGAPYGELRSVRARMLPSAARSSRTSPAPK